MCDALAVRAISSTGFGVWRGAGVRTVRAVHYF